MHLNAKKCNKKSMQIIKCYSCACLILIVGASLCSLMVLLALN